MQSGLSGRVPLLLILWFTLTKLVTPVTLVVAGCAGYAG